uniref:non-specific serine/threonine protein kinase n=1 Tax=Phallusia mammillata TaxID=59560 RepID=A0A6F9DFY7_9ASCI|nr:interleukin-1 receptor-associated kinase 4-like [Phallusia mammillata]
MQCSMASSKMESTLIIPYSSRKYIDDIPADRRSKLCTEIDYTIHKNEGYWEKLVSRLGFDETHSKKLRLSFEMHGSPTENLLRDCSYRMLRIRHLYEILVEIGLVQLAQEFLGEFDIDEDLPPMPTSLMFSVPPRSIDAQQYEGHFPALPKTKEKAESSNGWHGINTCHFDYKDISKGTNNFSHEMELGAGAFGKVYKVILNNTLFACKVLKIDKDNPLTTSVIETHRQHDDLRNELNYLAEYRHPNVIALYGWSLDGPDPCLIYDYMKNGSLQDRLQCLNKSEPMNWDIRVRVACGAARGLQFLHTMKSKPLIHGDIKTANILLDASYTAKLGDFGLAREMPWNASTSSYFHLSNEHTPGTLGYLANEYIQTKKLSVQVDTFAFGVVLLELYTGRRAYDRSKETPLLRDYMDNIACEAEKIGEEQASEKLFNLQDPQILKLPKELALQFVRLALQCCHERRIKRPKMANTLSRLEKIDQKVAVIYGRKTESLPELIDKQKYSQSSTTTTQRREWIAKNGYPDPHLSRNPVESEDHHSLLLDHKLSKYDSKLVTKSIDRDFDQLHIHASSEDDTDSHGPSSTGTSVSGQYQVGGTDTLDRPHQHGSLQAHLYTRSVGSNIGNNSSFSDDFRGTNDSRNPSDLYSPGPYQPAPSRVQNNNPYNLDLSRAHKPRGIYDDSQQGQQHQLAPIASSQWAAPLLDCTPDTFTSLDLDHQVNNSFAERSQVPKDLALPQVGAYSSSQQEEGSPSEAGYHHSISSFQFPSPNVPHPRSSFPSNSATSQSSPPPVSMNSIKETLMVRINEGQSYTQIFRDNSSRVPTESSTSD